MELAGWVGLGAVLWAGLGSTAPLAAPADHVRQAIEEMAGGDFAAANASLDDATREVLSTAAVVSGSALAEIHYYRGILIYYSGGDRDAALAEWWRALEKVDALAWDVGLVADPDAQALFEELRQDVRKLPRIEVVVGGDERVDVVYIDGRAMGAGASVVDGTHLVQVRCVDGSLGTFLHDYGVPPQYGYVCGDVDSGPGWFSRQLARLLGLLGRDRRFERDRLPRKDDAQLVGIAGTDRDAGRRGDALRILHDRGSGATSQVAREMAVSDAEAGNRELAVSVLEDIGTEDDAGAVALVMAADVDPDLRRKAAVVLRKRWPCAAREPLARRLGEEKDSRAVIEIGYALVVCGQVLDRPAVHETLLGHIDPTVRAGLANALALSGPLEADRAALTKLLEDPIDEPAISGAWALASLGDAEARAVLQARSQTAEGRRGREFARASEP